MGHCFLCHPPSPRGWPPRGAGIHSSRGTHTATVRPPFRNSTAPSQCIPVHEAKGEHWRCATSQQPSHPVSGILRMFLNHAFYAVFFFLPISLFFLFCCSISLSFSLTVVFFFELAQINCYLWAFPKALCLTQKAFIFLKQWSKSGPNPQKPFR